MGNSNRELQLQKNCQLYAYVLVSQGKEVSDRIQECVDSSDADEYDCLVDCVVELSEAIKSLDSEAFDRIVNNKESSDARELAHWWEMYQKYIPVS